MTEPRPVDHVGPMTMEERAASNKIRFAKIAPELRAYRAQLQDNLKPKFGQIPAIPANLRTPSQVEELRELAWLEILDCVFSLNDPFE